MAKENLYIPAPDIVDIAKELQKQYIDELGNIDLDKICFLKEIESEKGNKYAVTKTLDKITRAIYSKYNYVIIFFQKKIENMTAAQLHLLVYHELRHVHPEGEGSIKHNIEDFDDVIITFGVGWATNPNLKDMLKEKISIKHLEAV